MKNFFFNKDTNILAGDFNIAPYEDDVWSHKQLSNVVSHTEIERKKLVDVLKHCEFMDTTRKFISSPDNLFTWWSYRSPNFLVNNVKQNIKLWFVILYFEIVISFFFNEDTINAISSFPFKTVLKKGMCIKYMNWYLSCNSVNNVGIKQGCNENSFAHFKVSLLFQMQKDMPSMFKLFRWGQKWPHPGGSLVLHRL